MHRNHCKLATHTPTIISGVQFASSVIHKCFRKTPVLHHKQVTLTKQRSRNREPEGSRSSASSKPTHPRCSSAAGWGGSLGNRSSLLAIAPAFAAPARHAWRLRLAGQTLEKGRAEALSQPQESQVCVCCSQGSIQSENRKMPFDFTQLHLVYHGFSKTFHRQHSGLFV